MTRRERRWRGPLRDQQRSSRGLLVALVLGCLTVMSLDSLSSSPIDPARRAVGAVFGPAEVASANAVRPFTAVPRWFRSRDSMQPRKVFWIRSGASTSTLLRKKRAIDS